MTRTLAAFCCGCLIASSGPALAQDSRQVSEPSFPSSCQVLQARLRAKDGKLDETSSDTSRIQHALDACPAGHAVTLQAAADRNAFLSGPLSLRSGVTLLIAKGAVLFASRNPRDYDLTPGSCGVVNARGHGCKALINGERVDHAAVMGEGVIDGRGAQTLLGQSVSWWDLAHEAKVKNLNQSCPRLLSLNACNDFRLYRITLRNSPNFHVSYKGGIGFTAWGVTIDAPKLARNTDGIDPANAINVTITHCFIHTGDDQVAIKAGGQGGPAENISILHNHFYTGHGISIGSETDAGVHHVLISDLTIDGADNGIRIKSNDSRGGLVTNVTYEDICIRNTKNPILMNTHYSYSGSGHDKVPVFHGIALHHVHIDGGGKLTFDGYDPAHRLQITLDDVTAADPSRINLQTNHTELSLGPGPVNFQPAGPDVQLSGTKGSTTSSAQSCLQRFLPMPADRK